MTRNEDDGEVEGREPHHETINSGLTFASLAYVALSILGTFVGLLLWQVWINTGRLDRIEPQLVTSEKEMVRIEKEAQRGDDRTEKRLDQLMTRIDALALICEELKRQKP